MNLRPVVAQNEVYSAFLSLKYGQKIQYKSQTYFPKGFSPSQEDEKVYLACKGKYLVSDNPLAYITVTPAEQLKLGVSFFYGIAVAFTEETQERGEYIRLLDARMSQLFFTYVLYKISKQDLLLVEELAQTFGIQVLASALEEKEGSVSMLFLKSKEFGQPWILRALSALKRGDLPLVEVKLFSLTSSKEQRAFNRLVALKAFFKACPHLSHLSEQVKVGADGRAYFPLASLADLEKVKTLAKQAYKELKGFKVAKAVVPCDDKTMPFCLAVRKYLHAQGSLSYLIDPIGNRAFRYIITNHEQEVAAKDISLTEEKGISLEEAIGIYDLKSISSSKAASPSSISAPASSSSSISAPASSSSSISAPASAVIPGLLKSMSPYYPPFSKLPKGQVKVDSTVGPILLSIPEKDISEWTKEFYRLKEQLSALNISGK